MSTAIDQFVAGIEIKGKITPEAEEILTPDAIQFISKLHNNFNFRRLELLEKREKKQKEINCGIMPNFLEETRWVRESDWTVAPLPDDLMDRRVEITGPVDRKMIINA